MVLAAVMFAVTAAVMAVVALDGEGVTDLSALAAQVGVAMPEINEADKESEPAKEEPESVLPIELYDEPEEMRAVTIRAGEDFPLDKSEDEIRAAVKKAVDYVSSMEVMNTIVIETQTRDGKVAYESRAQESAAGNVDALAIALEEARAKGFYTYMVFHVTDCNTGEMPVVQHIVDADLLDAVSGRAKSPEWDEAPEGYAVPSSTLSSCWYVRADKSGGLDAKFDCVYSDNSCAAIILIWSARRGTIITPVCMWPVRWISAFDFSCRVDKR